MSDRPLSKPARARVQALELEAAERRVREGLRRTPSPPSAVRRAAIIAIAVALFAVTFGARLAINDPGALIANFYLVPIALLAIEFGTRAGLLAAAFGIVLVFAWGAIDEVHVTPLGYIARGAALLIAGAVVGWFSDRLRHDVSERRRAQRHLSLYADQLERANQNLAQSVEGLEAFAEIARAVGGETDLERILSLITAHGSEIAGARRLIVFLHEGDELVAMSADGQPETPPQRFALHGSAAGEVLLSGRPRRLSPGDDERELAELAPDAATAILVPVSFRGEMLGVLAGIDRIDGRAFEAADEELLASVAASAATAVATARSVASERLTLSMEAAEEARARWARELHDETLQALTGVRMVLGAGLAHDDLSALRRAAETADAHLGTASRSLRGLIAELRPAALDDLGLGPALETLAQRQAAIGAFGVDTRIELGEDDRLARDIEGAIYRIAQEALSNAAKHSGAAHVVLRVDRLADRVEITVRDDGCGFEPERTGEGFGLTGMRERATLAGGRLAVSSCAGGPTSVTAVLPAPRGSGRALEQDGSSEPGAPELSRTGSASLRPSTT